MPRQRARQSSNYLTPPVTSNVSPVIYFESDEARNLKTVESRYGEGVLQLVIASGS